jgi:hypothetical protein
MMLLRSYLDENLQPAVVHLRLQHPPPPTQLLGKAHQRLHQDLQRLDSWDR